MSENADPEAMERWYIVHSTSIRLIFRILVVLSLDPSIALIVAFADVAPREACNNTFDMRTYLYFS